MKPANIRMMKRLLSVITKPLAASIIALLAASNSVQAEDVEAGRDIAERLCAKCHAIGPSSDSSHADAPSFREIASRYDVWNLQEALAEGIVVGHDDMPEFTLTPEQINALLVYMDGMTPPPDKR
jgi:mono/diheme cytochrome c family protein